MLGAIGAAAYLFVARSAHDVLEPLLFLPIGQAAYASFMQHVAFNIALFGVPLVLLVGIASYFLASISVRPLAQARAREERFAADAAHELRTPLATIATVAQAARESEAGHAQRSLETIAATALDASELVGDLMLLMRDERADTRLHEPVDLAELARAVTAQVQAPAIALACDVPAAGAYVSGDARALRRLVRNLVENAVRHARTSVQVTVRADGAQVALSVEDDGPGVPEADRARIFDRFYKARRESSGSGLGLAICRRITHAHAGTIVLDGPSRFIARLPALPL
ncbi:MAG: hypothetical protein NVSMB64_05760 [Candidatus Velthaea sp.]